MLERLLAAIESIAESLKIIAAMTGDAPATTDAAPEKAPSKPRGRPAKAQAEAAPPVDPAPPAAAAPPFDYNLLKDTVIKLANLSADGKAAAISLLGEYKVAKASDAPEALWPEMHAKFSAKLQELSTPAAAEFA